MKKENSNKLWVSYIDIKIRDIRSSLSWYNKAYRECDEKSYYKKSYKRTINILEGSLSAYRDIRRLLGGDESEEDS